jgi:nucleoprotein TPR
MAAAAVDTAYIAASYSVPETTITSLLDSPTTELVRSLLEAIEAKAHEYDDLKAEKLRVDVELETAVHAGEQRARSLKASMESSLKEVEDVRKKLADAGKSGTSLCPVACLSLTVDI